MKEEITTHQVSFGDSDPFFWKPFIRNAHIGMLADTSLASPPAWVIAPSISQGAHARRAWAWDSLAVCSLLGESGSSISTPSWESADPCPSPKPCSGLWEIKLHCTVFTDSWWLFNPQEKQGTRACKYHGRTAPCTAFDVSLKQTLNGSRHVKKGSHGLMHSSSLWTCVPFPTVTVKVFPPPFNCLPEALLTHGH